LYLNTTILTKKKSHIGMFTGVQSKLIQIKTENQFRKPKPKKTNFFFVFGYSFVKTAQLDYGY
jgi:hypothetical protein